MGQVHTLPPTLPAIISTLCSIYQSEKPNSDQILNQENVFIQKSHF